MTDDVPGTARPAAQGVQFPSDESGARHTMPVNRAVFADSVRGVDPSLAERIDATVDWRGGYLPLVREVTETGARSADFDREVARAGLASVRERLVVRRGESEYPLDDGPSLEPAFELGTETVTGRAEPHRDLTVPYRGQRLRGDALRKQADDWVQGGIIEPSAAAALDDVIDNPDWLGLPGRRVALVGAGAETSPLSVLAAWGVDVLALDLPRPDIWRRVLTTASAGAGSVQVPVRPGARSSGLADRSGGDLIAELPEVTDWLRRTAEGSPLVLGFYIYADGALHVQATASADAIGRHLTGAGYDVTPAFAGTPSDCYLVPPEVVADSTVRRTDRGLRRYAESAVRTVTRGRIYAPAYGELLPGDDGRDWGVADALVKEQGPNYTLAKRMQRWRCVEAWAEGRAASFNVAPPTWTHSVTKNRLLAAGYHGAHLVGMEVFEPDTMRTLMTALLVHDLMTMDETERARHPELLVAANAVHGGYWRRPFEIRSTLTYTALLGIPKAYAPTLRFR